MSSQPDASREGAYGQAVGSATSVFSPLWVGEGYSPGPQIVHHPDFERLMSRIPEAQRRMFTDEQLAHISRAVVPTKAQHIIDYRVSFPFFGRRYYLTIFFGKERRSVARLIKEGLLTVRKTQIFYSLFAVVTGLLAAAVFMFVLYLFGAALNLDIPDDPSFFTDFVFSG